MAVVLFLPSLLCSTGVAALVRWKFIGQGPSETLNSSKK
jgi:hypothetical protein